MLPKVGNRFDFVEPIDGSLASIIGRNHSTKFGIPPLPGPLPQSLRLGGRGDEEKEVMVGSPVAVATGKCSVGPSSLDCNESSGLAVGLQGVPHETSGDRLMFTR